MKRIERLFIVIKFPVCLTATVAAANFSSSNLFRMAGRQYVRETFVADAQALRSNADLRTLLAG